MTRVPQCSLPSLVLAASLLILTAPGFSLRAQAPATALCTKAFVEVTPTAPACGFSLTEAGKLLKDKRRLADPLAAGYEEGTRGRRAIAARKVVLFPPSPSGRFRILQACDGLGSDALCWSVFAADGKRHILKKAYAGHYGPLHWQSWSADETHAVLASRSEGASWLHVVDMTSGKSRSFPDETAQVNWTIEPETLRWTGARSFVVTAKTCAECPREQQEIRF